MNHITLKFVARPFSPYEYFLLRSSFWPPKSKVTLDHVHHCDLCRALKIFYLFLGLFSILAHRFVAIELLAFFINTKFYFYCSRELLVFGIKKNPYVNRIDSLLFVYIKNVSQKNCFFIWMKITMNTISEIQRARYIYTKGKTNCKKI